MPSSQVNIKFVQSKQHARFVPAMDLFYVSIDLTLCVPIAS